MLITASFGVYFLHFKKVLSTKEKTHKYFPALLAM